MIAGNYSTRDGFLLSENFSLNSNSSLRRNSEPHSLVVWFTTYLVLCLIAATTNLALLIAVLKDKKSATATRILIVNLTVGTMFISAVFFPGVAVAILVRPYIATQPPRYCDIYSATLFTVQAGTCWAEVCIAVNRLVAICFPHHYNTYWKGLFKCKFKR